MSDNQSQTALSGPQRFLSLTELAVGSAIVIGHNVFHVVPNEVPILFVLGILSIRLRDGSFRAIGLGRPKSWWRTVLIAVVAAAVVIAMGEFVTDPLAKYLGTRVHEQGRDRARHDERRYLDGVERPGAGLDFRRLRRGDRLPALSARTCGRSRQSHAAGLLDRARLRVLLSGSVTTIKARPASSPRPATASSSARPIS